MFQMETSHLFFKVNYEHMCFLSYVQTFKHNPHIRHTIFVQTSLFNQTYSQG